MFCWGSEIERGKRLTFTPTRMRRACKGPGLARRKRKPKLRLLKTARQNDHGLRPGITEKVLVNARQPLGSDRNVIFVPGIQPGKVILQSYRPRVLPGIRSDERFVWQFNFFQFS